MFKNLKSLFIEEEETGSEKPAPKVEKSKTTAPEPPPRVSVAESTSGDPGKVTGQFVEILLKSMEVNNLDGFDYLEYKQSLKSLEKMPMDEVTRYQSAFAMAQTMGATPDKLIQTAQHYINVLQQEERKFEEALAHQRTKQIGMKEQEIAQLESSIQGKAEQIKQLTQEIEASRQQSEALKGEISEASQKVESTKNNFIASFNALVGQINDDMDKMGKYLK